MMNRREHMLALGTLAVLAPWQVRAAGSRSEPFSWGLLVARARSLARKPYQPVQPRTHSHAIDYDAVSQISYRADKTLLPDDDGKGGIRLFPLSRYAQTPIELALVSAGRATPFSYNPSLFEAQGQDVATLLAENDGFAGFRAMNSASVGDWLAYQGASYFRSAGPLNQYGLSARGLAINTSVPGVSEEFPAFTHFWLERGPDQSLIVHALLDGPSITGAYRFVNRKLDGAVTQDVTQALFLRKDIQQLGIAPLTSMFWYSEGNREKGRDWRPEIHDSDGLAMFTGAGERIWRPLVNPPRAATSSFSDNGPRAFGLLQRDRAFDHYQDDGVFYEKRPSLWIEPKGDWGKGAVTLFEIPTEREIDDNIVAFWVPAKPARAGARFDYAYRMNWIGDEPQPIDVARAIDVWTGTAGRPGHEPTANARKIVADFVGGNLASYTQRGQVAPGLNVSGGKILEAHCYPVEGMPGRWRLTADVGKDSADTTDVRAFLKAGNTSLTETLIYQLHWLDGR